MMFDPHPLTPEEILLSLPREAVAVISELLHGSGDEDARAVARRLDENLGFALSPGDYEEQLFRSLPAHPVDIRPRELPNAVNYTQVDPMLVAGWFGPDGEFARAMPGYESRREQMEMAAAVADAFSSGRHLVAEAGTGVGKTMAYLVPSVLWSLANKVPVVISTNTKNLQEQIYRKDLPLIAGLLRSPVRFALIKGRSNYLCLNRLQQLLSRREGELMNDEFPVLAKAIVWAFQTTSGDLAEFDPGPPPADASLPMEERICSSGDECHGRACPYYSRCFLQRARAASLAADVVITNHSVVFSEPEAKPLALPRCAQIVFDEAHNLEAAATDAMSLEVTYPAARKLVRRLVRSRGTGRRPAGLLYDLQDAAVGEGLMATTPARDLLLALLLYAHHVCDAYLRAIQAYCRALGRLPRPQESTYRLIPGQLDGVGWENTMTPLHSVQDALYDLVKTLQTLSDILQPKPGEDGGLPRYLVLQPDQIAKLLPSSAADGKASPVTMELSPSWTDDPTGDAKRTDFARRVDACRDAFSEQQTTLGFVTSLEDQNYAYWVSVPGETPGGRAAVLGGLHAAPVEVAGYLSETLFANKDSVILCSATMSVGGKTDFLEQRLGLSLLEPESLMTLRMGSPFEYERQCLAAAPLFLPEQTGRGDSWGAGGDFVEAFSRMAGSIARLTGGRMLILFTSYRTMGQVAAALSDGLAGSGIRVLWQGNGHSREALTAMFREEDTPSVLLGTDSFWEGVDLIGDTLLCLIIAKFPFPAPNEPLTAARCEAVDRKEGANASFAHYSVPTALIKFRQGFGRLIRHKGDRGIFIIADTRIRSGGKSYAARFRRELPVALREYADEAKLEADIQRFLAGDVPQMRALPPAAASSAGRAPGRRPSSSPAPEAMDASVTAPEKPARRRGRAAAAQEKPTAKKHGRLHPESTEAPGPHKPLPHLPGVRRASELL